MTLNLKKAEKINLTKTFPGLKKVRLELEWTDANIDADASAFICDENTKLLNDSYFVFYNPPNDSCPEKAVVYGGDARKGGVETIKIDLEKVTHRAREIALVVTIYESIEKNLHFGNLKSGGISLYNEETGEKMASFQFGTGEYTNESLIHMASLYKGENGWEFEAFGRGTAGADLAYALEMFTK